MWKNSNENPEDWSLRSNSTPDTRDVWTDTEKEHDDLMMSERSDSGVTSPHSHHQLDDRTSLPSPCDLSMIDSIPNDDVRKRIIAMTKRPCYDDDDKLCLLQILSLLNNLEALSQDQEITGEFLSLGANQSRRSGSTENYSVLTEETPNRLKNQARIVATVQPYSSGLDSEEPIKPRFTSPPNTPETCGKRGKNLSTSTLQESGVFDTDPSDAVTQSTQTSPEDFPVYEARSGDLTAEIQKLNKFRERIEECVTAKKSSVVNLLSPEQKRLQYYKERLELLENKILVYESSGDLQVRRLAERLQREIHLEALVKQLSGKLEELEKENRIIDEERCEFEEAENDTRLRLQRLEVEFENSQSAQY
uniref:Janus kinase and microtubule-interacting protein C-terminal domain-containing protein n=1 Tax=Lutzomyia longipalpis TaxID=7200 RepID=A0A1B0CDP7_LUTLO